MQTPKRVLAAVAMTLLALGSADAAPHRPRAAKQTTAKHATAKPAKVKRLTAAHEAKPAPRSADEPAAKPDPAPAKPAPPRAAVSQAEDSEDPPVRQRAK